MTGRIIALILLGMAGTGRSAEGWHWQNPRPSAADYYALHMTDTATGFMAGCCGSILKTTDGGRRWIPAPTGRSDLAVRGLSFPTADTGYASGDSGYVFKTVNGGKDWSPMRAAPTREAFTSIHFPTPLAGCAVGSLGMIARTRDGGATWDTAYPAGPAGTSSLVSVRFTDRNTGYACGYPGLLLKTTDGGVTWNPQNTGPAKNLLSVRFVSADTGMAVGDSGLVLATQDGGANWTWKRLGTYALTALAYADSRNAFAVSMGSSNPLYATGDGGVTWSARERPDLLGQNTLQFPGGGIGYAAGYRGRIYKTVDLGRTWSELFTGNPHYDLEAIAFPAPSVGVAVGSSGSIARTADAGRSWTFDIRSSDADLHAVHFYDSATGFIAGGNDYTDGGLMLRTDDAGLSWHPLPTGIRTPLYGLHFTDRLRGVAVGGIYLPTGAARFEAGVVIRTADGGATWDSLPLPRIPVLKGVHFPGPGVGVGYACGDSGAVLRTLDGGATWVRLPAPTPQNLNAIRFLDARTGVAVGTRVVLRTEDSGGTWTRFPGDTLSSWRSLSLAGRDTLWITGVDGAVLRSTDAGRTWSDQRAPTRLDLAGSYFLDSRTGYAVGPYGAILHRGLEELEPLPVSIGSKAGLRPARGRTASKLRGFDARGRRLRPR